MGVGGGFIQCNFGGLFMKTTTYSFGTARAFFAMLAIIALLAAPMAPVFATTTNTDNNNGDTSTVENNDGGNNGEHENNGGGDDSSKKVTICHYSATSTYEQISVSKESIDEDNGHGHHVNDIIPPFTKDDEGSYAGKNWDTAGQATWNNKCVVPVKDLCPNIQGIQNPIPEGMVLNDGECITPVPKQCFVVSDATNFLGTTTNPAVLTYVHPSWTTALATGTAKWIWNAALVTDPSVSETATFTKYFNVDVAPTGATLRVAADNSYTVSLNGSPLSCDGSSSDNFHNPIDTCSAPVVAGMNVLTFTVTNDPSGTDPKGNPAGLDYELQVDGSSCSPVQDACLNIDGMQTEVPKGYEANSDHMCTPVKAPFCRVGSNLLQNASFETPVAPTGGWNIFATVANWAISNDGLEIWNKFNASTGAGFASDGDQNAELDGNSPSTISQVITTTPGATYELRYDFSPRAGTNLADNSLAAQADGVTVSAASADGSANTGNVWSTHSTTFVATSTATTITFKDLGTANSLGTLLDNTGVCFVSAAPAPTCNLVEVSGTTTQVVETEGNGMILSYLHPAWTAVIAGANWIWGTNPVAQTQTDLTETFKKTFVWHGAVGTANLMLAADNSYVVKLNGTQIGADAGEFNYNIGGQDVITGFSGLIVDGTNTLEIAVTNKGVEGSDAKGNPAGLLYKLTVTGSDKACTPTDGGGDNGGGGTHPPLYHIIGNVWNDGNQNDGKDEDESNLAGFTISITDGETTYSTTTDANGNYYFDVPAGTWTITEGAQNGWALNFPDTGSYIITVPAAPLVEAKPNAFLALFVNVAEAAVINTTYGPYSFGNHVVPPTTGGGSNGGGSSGGHSGSHNHGGNGGNGGSNGEVLGASDAKVLPNGEVLGAVAPVGAPNTGEGGADTNTTSNALTALFAALLGLALALAPKRA